VVSVQLTGTMETTLKSSNAVLVTALVICSGASAQVPASTGPTETANTSANPQQALTSKDVILHPLKRLAGGPGFYPERAQRLHVPGSADIACVVSADQRLRACKVVAEAPRGMGFGEGALALFSNYSVDPVAEDGSPTAGRPINLHANFGRGG
jgi:hypothetical protein